MPTGFYVIAVLTTVLIGGIELMWRTVLEPRGAPHEVGRKAHHIGIGCTAIAMPFCIDSAALGITLALGFGVCLLTFYKLGILRSLYKENPKDGDVVFRRFQHAWIGPATYSLAVALLSVFFYHHHVIWVASLLILILGDSAATVFGSWLGRDPYLIFGTRRSLAGNLALLILASLVLAGTLAPTGVMARALTADVIATAVLFGLLLALTETISPFGLDNLTLPLMTAVVMLSLADAQGGFVITGDTVLAFALVSFTALLFTAAHLEPAYLDGAALMLGISTIALWDMKRYLFVVILLIFLACTLLANWIAQRQQIAHHREGAEILAQVAPCVLFLALQELHPASSMAVGSLACVVLLAARFWAGHLPAPTAAPRRRGVILILQAVASSAGAVAAVVAGGLTQWVWSLDRRTATLLTVAMAALVGGLVTALVVRTGPAADSEGGDSFLAHLVPGMLAVSAIPAVATLVLGLIG